jgi:signal transduction histidine kinase
LLRTVAREKELSELKSNFVSLVSHEFRTPLRHFHFAEILRDYSRSCPRPSGVTP